MSYWMWTVFVPAAALWILDEVRETSVIRRAIGRQLRALTRIQKVLMPDDRAVFADSWRVYGQIPYWLRDKQEKLAGWLEESVGETAAEEIYLVERKRARGRIQGVLYASLYKHPHNRCFVSHVIADLGLEPRAALDISLSLWQRLQEEVRRTGREGACEFYFEEVRSAEGVSPPLETEGREDDEALRRARYREFLRKVGAEEIFSNYVVPDFGSPQHSRQFTASLLYRGKDLPAPPQDEVLDFVYGVFHFWAFSYGEEVIGLKALKDRVSYLAELSSSVMSGAVQGNA